MESLARHCERFTTRCFVFLRRYSSINGFRTHTPAPAPDLERSLVQGWSAAGRSVALLASEGVRTDCLPCPCPFPYPSAFAFASSASSGA